MRLRPNHAFKPKPLRSANHMAGKACHVVRSTARLGLTWVLGPGEGDPACPEIERKVQGT